MSGQIRIETYESEKTGTWFMATTTVRGVTVRSEYRRSVGEARFGLLTELAFIGPELDSIAEELCGEQP